AIKDFFEIRFEKSDQNRALNGHGIGRAQMPGINQRQLSEKASLRQLSNEDLAFSALRLDRNATARDEVHSDATFSLLEDRFARLKNALVDEVREIPE